MLKRLGEMFGIGADRDDDDGAAKHGELPFAATALLVETASMDGHFDQVERDRIRALIETRFEMAPEAAERLLADATEKVKLSTQLLPFTSAIKNGFDHDERVELMEMLWEIVYADGEVHDYEAALMRKIGGLIFVPDQDAGAARKRALARLGIASD